jgi:hypothetical protein
MQMDQLIQMWVLWNSSLGEPCDGTTEVLRSFNIELDRVLMECDMSHIAITYTLYCKPSA